MPIVESTRVAGKKLIGMRWVDVNTQDGVNPRYRLRLFAGEVHRHPMPELYAAAPPSECFRVAAPAAMNSSVGRSVADSTSKVMMCGVPRGVVLCPGRPGSVREDRGWGLAARR